MKYEAEIEEIRQAIAEKEDIDLEFVEVEVYEDDYEENTAEFSFFKNNSWSYGKYWIARDGLVEGVLDCSPYYIDLVLEYKGREEEN